MFEHQNSDKNRRKESNIWPVFIVVCLKGLLVLWCVHCYGGDLLLHHSPVLDQRDRNTQNEKWRSSFRQLIDLSVSYVERLLKDAHIFVGIVSPIPPPPPSTDKARMCPEESLLSLILSSLRTHKGRAPNLNFCWHVLLLLWNICMPIVWLL